MKEVTRDFVVGCVTFVGLLALAFLLMSFGELDAYFRDRYTVTVQMPQAAGLRVGSTVEYNRVPIGRIGEVRIAPENHGRVEVIALIDAVHTLPANIDAEVAIPLIGGSAVLNLRLPPEITPQGTLAQDGTAVVHADPKTLFEELKAELDQRLEPFTRSIEKIDTLATTYNDLGHDLRELISPQSEADLAAGAAPNIRTAIIRLNATLEQAQRSLALADEWLGDQSLRDEIHETIARAQGLLDESSLTVTRYRDLATALEEDADTLTQRFLPVADQIAITLEDVRLVSRRALEGPGTVSELLNNPTLYLSLNDAAIRLERALGDIQLLIQQVRAEGLKVDF